MESQEIKKECEKLYLEIKLANERLEELRKLCKHEETFEGNYSWREGSYYPADICLFCNTPVKSKEIEAIISSNTSKISFGPTQEQLQPNTNKRLPHQS